jgi:hypothetical protein
MEQIQVKDQPGKGFIAVHLKVLDGQYINQVQIDRLNIYGQSETATRIGYKRLSAYAHIAGKLRVANASELVGTKLIATCGPQDPPNEKYSEVKIVKDIAGNVPVHGQPAAQQPAPGQPFGQTQQPQQPATGFAAQGGGFAAAGGGFPAQAQPAQGGWNNPAQPQQPQQPAATQPPANAWQTGTDTPAAPAQGGGGQPPWVK